MTGDAHALARAQREASMEIHWRNVEELGAEERARAEERIRALGDGHRDLIDVQIHCSETGHHRRGAKAVRIVCQARQREIVASREASDLGLALDSALDAFEREVRKLRDRRQQQRSPRTNGPPHLGIVDRVLPEQGYGFILTDGGESVYFHRNAVHGGLDFERLEEGQRVALNLEAGNEGLQATVVLPPPPDAPSP
jgi:ribosomal subunit interface protein